MPRSTPAHATPTPILARTLAGLAEGIEASRVVLLVGWFAIAVLLVLSCVPWGQNADDLLPTLISLQKPTLYFWGQNRFANLLPVLTAWIGSPLHNAEAQIALRIVAGLIAPAFFCALFYQRAWRVWCATLAADSLMLVASSPDVLHETYIVATPYGTSFACGAFAILALRRAWRGDVGWRRFGLETFGVVSLLAAHLVNYGLGMIVLPLVGFLCVTSPTRERYRFLLLNVVATAIAFLAPAAFAPEYTTHLGLAPAPGSLGQFAASIWSGTGLVFALCVLLPMAMMAVAIWKQGHRRLGRRIATFAAATWGTVLIAFLLAGWSLHVAGNSFNIRYAVPALLALLALGGIGCRETARLCLPARAMRTTMLTMLSVLALLLARDRLAASGDGTPDVIGHGEALLARAVAARAASLSLEGIAGDYWHVWPAVFAAEQLRYEAGEQRAGVIGVTQRGEARRGEFLARLAAHGTLRLGCIDFAVPRCLEEISVVMRPPGSPVGALRIREVAAQPLPDGHELRIVELSPTAQP